MVSSRLIAGFNNKSNISRLFFIKDLLTGPRNEVVCDERPHEKKYNKYAHALITPFIVCSSLGPRFTLKILLVIGPKELTMS